MERVLDPAHKHPLTAVEDGLTAVDEYEKVDSRGRPTITVISELLNSLTQAIVKGDYWESPAGQAQRLFEALKLDRKQRADLLLKVDGDPNRYEEIKNLAKNVFPNDSALLFNNAYVEGGSSSSSAVATWPVVSSPSPSPGPSPSWTDATWTPQPPAQEPSPTGVYYGQDKSSFICVKVLRGH